MATKVNSLEAWNETRNTLVENLGVTYAFLVDEPTSDDPTSGYRRGKAEVRRILDELERLSIVGLKQIDDQIAASSLIADITGLAREAKQEADRIKNAAKTIAGIAKAVDMIAGVVTKIAGLPFL
jgi:hypothetical protein